MSSSLFSWTLTPASSRLLRPSTPVTAPRVSPPCWPLRPIRRPPIKAEAVPASHTRHRPVSLPLKPSLFLNVQNGSPASSPLNVLWLSARVIRASPAPTLPGRCFGRGSSGSCSAGPLLPCGPPLTLPHRGLSPLLAAPRLQLCQGLRSRPRSPLGTHAQLSIRHPFECPNTAATFSHLQPLSRPHCAQTVQALSTGL